MAGAPVSRPVPTPSDADDGVVASSLPHTTTFLFSVSDSISGASGTLETVPNDTLDPARQRKLHHKTKTGCLNCKRRRVKCDEKIPRCSNCSRRKELCERPDEAGCLSPKSSGAVSPPSPSSSPSLLQTPSMGADGVVNLSHMKLFHHFQTCTQSTLLFGREVWEPAIKLSLDFPSLMHAIFCISARHLVYLFPEETKYASAAAIHLSQALTLFREDLSGSFSPANVDAFMATAVLLHHDLWTHGDFVSVESNGSMAYDTNKDRLFDLSSGLRHIFINSIPHAFERPSIFVPPIRHSPRKVLVNSAHISKATLDNFSSYFAYDQPLDRKLLQVPLPFLRSEDTRDQDIFDHEVWPVSSVHDAYGGMVHRLCLLTSFLPEAQPEQGSEGLAPDIIQDFARYAFSLPILVDKPFAEMMKRNDPMALVLMYHFFRTIRIVLPAKQCWWMHNRAGIAEIVLRAALEKQLSESSSI